MIRGLQLLVFVWALVAPALSATASVPVPAPTQVTGSVVQPVAGSPAPAPTGHVRATRGALVYLDLGRAAGVRGGDILTTDRGAKLRVVYLGEEQAAARRLDTTAVRLGDVVPSPRPPGSPSAARDVVSLPPPHPLSPSAASALWSSIPTRRADRIPVPDQPPGATTASSHAVRGELSLDYGGWIDGGDANLDLHRVALRSKLTVDGLAGGPLSYSHDIAARVEAGPRLAERGGAHSRPYYKLRRLSLRWQRGPIDASLGRLAVAHNPSTGLIDGAQAELDLGHGLWAGVHGGLVPDLRDIGLSTDRAVFGGHARWAGATGPWRARFSLDSVGTLWRHDLDRVELGASASLEWRRDLRLRARVVATSLADTMGLDQPTTSLSRAYVHLYARPLWWLSVDASYRHDRVLADREILALLGPDYPVTAARESTTLVVRLRPSAAVDVSLTGGFGVGFRGAEQQLAMARLTLPRLPAGLIATAGYRFTQTPSVRAQTADLHVSLPLDERFDLSAGYGFSTFQARLLDERQDEHRIDAGVDLALAGPWRLTLRAEVGFGDLPNRYGLFARAAWRFR